MAWPKRSVFGGSSSNGTGVGAVIPQGGIPPVVAKPPGIEEFQTTMGGKFGGGDSISEYAGKGLRVRAMPLKQREAVMGKLRGPAAPKI